MSFVPEPAAVSADLAAVGVRPTPASFRMRVTTLARTNRTSPAVTMLFDFMLHFLLR